MDERRPIGSLTYSDLGFRVVVGEVAIVLQSVRHYGDPVTHRLMTVLNDWPPLDSDIFCDVTDPD